MTLKAIILAVTTAIGVVSMAACDKPEPGASLQELPKAQPKVHVDPSVPKAELGSPTTEERKESSMLAQSEVRHLDYENKK